MLLPSELYRLYSLEIAAEGFDVIKQIKKNPGYKFSILKIDPNDTSKDMVKYEFDLKWMVSGLPAKNAARTVKVGDSVAVYSLLSPIASVIGGETNIPRGDPYYSKSSVKTAQVVEGTNTTPTDGSGGGGSNSGSTDLPIAGRVESPIRIDSIGELLVALLKYLVGFLGGLAVLFIVIGGVRMVTSAGIPSQIEAGKKTITWAVIGLVVALLAFKIVNVLQNVLQVK